MELSYIQDCQSCGAPIEVEEADRVIECAFCNIRNYMVKEKPLRFVLPCLIPGDTAPENIFYIPYLRFKGHIYSCYDNELNHKIVDTTQLGYSSLNLPHSLGLRPQAMQIRLASYTTAGRFARLTEKVKDIFHKASQLTDVFKEQRYSIHHRAFIGETLSVIYLPTYLEKGVLYDGVIKRKISQNVSREMLEKLSCEFKKEWLPKYISTNCPHCGAAMSGAYDTLMMVCRNCSTMWQEQEGTFKKVVYSLVESENQEIHIPFWKIKSRVSGVRLQSYADYLHLTNQPIAIQEKYKSMGIHFWIPAFKIRPRYFLHFAKNLTLGQYKISPGTAELRKNIYPVTLPREEANQALKISLAAAVLNKKQFLPQLQAVTMDDVDAELIFLPFKYLGHDLIQTHTGVTVAANILHHGRSM